MVLNNILAGERNSSWNVRRSTVTDSGRGITGGGSGYAALLAHAE
jgi:hypothetical protein